ncbi:Protein phosphatase 2C family protein [Rhynchospora pubera]|uniref:protein-serine/threonine phosphatase n=1 Tax=Rhynchospora pubera TaxID=906938 RepID=A0AAV8H795_9POAL|nr:Protein phosphatase 2C family protein [Rhynchospora pubera]
MGSCMSTHPQPPPAMPGDSSASVSRSASWSERWVAKKEKQRVKRNDKARQRGAGLFSRAQSLHDGDGDAAANGALTSLDELSGVSGRMYLNGASEVASIYTQQGKKGTNQDAMVVFQNFNCDLDTVFCGVFDGHGPYGHLVAKKVRDSLPLKICTEWRALSCKPDENGNGNGNASLSVSGSVNSEDMECINFNDELSEPNAEADEAEKMFPETFRPLKESFFKAFKLMDWDLKKHQSIDCFCSGTTAVTLVKKGFDLVVGNLGDSRAVLGTRDDENNLIAEQLTVDLKPNLPRESARIKKCNGRVFALQDEPDVARVWLPNSDSPGLAMARAFGDFCLKNYGLISVPEVTYRRLTVKDEFIILATDGIWDVLSNKEAVDIVFSSPTRATAARALVDSAVRSWKLKFPTSKSDDCAVVCLFLDSKSPSDPIQDPMPKDLPPSAIDKPNEEKEENHKKEEDADVCESIEPNSEQSVMLHGADEIIPISEELDTIPSKGLVSSSSAKRLADCISNSEEEEWSALEGVTRANSLLNLPRFLLRDKKSSSRRKK